MKRTARSPLTTRALQVLFKCFRRRILLNLVVARGFADWGNNQPHIFGGDLDGKYKLDQIHFHWAMENVRGSEHTFASLHYPVEVSARQPIQN